MQAERDGTKPAAMHSGSWKLAGEATTMDGERAAWVVAALDDLLEASRLVLSFVPLLIAAAIVRWQRRGR
jgi:hypothetical protein